MHFTRPGESINSYIKSKPFPNLPEYRTAYFLFFRFRIATTSDANVSKIMNSSYVLIKYHTFLQTRERVGARLSASRVSILLSMCHSSCETSSFGLSCFRSVVRIVPSSERQPGKTTGDKEKRPDRAGPEPERGVGRRRRRTDYRGHYSFRSGTRRGCNPECCQEGSERSGRELPSSYLSLGRDPGYFERVWIGRKIVSF